MTKPRLDAPEVQAFRRRWRIRELEVFGSYLREDWEEGSSDIDLLATFEEDADWSLLDHVRMEEELAEILGHPVDLLNRRAVESSSNWMRRRSILEGARAVDAEG